MKRRIISTTLGIFGALALACPTSLCASQPTGARISNRALGDLIRPQNAFARAAGISAAVTREVGETRLVGESSSDHAKLEAFAAKVSYAGVLLLTADRVVRSMDSVLERMKITRPDGTRLGFEMGPTSEGMNVGIRVSRPIEF